MGKRKKTGNKVQKNTEKEIAQTDAERLKDLDKENELLRIEVECLKKWDTLVRQREQHERNKRK